MARKKPTVHKEREASFMFPRLHQAVATAVADDIGSTWFNQDSDQHPVKEWQTRIMGRFTCENEACDNSMWGSRTVATLIRGYSGNGYNATVFNQHCIDCQTLGAFMVDKDCYVERIAYRLKMWAGVEMERPDYNKKEGPPHEQELCEGCKRGYCQKNRVRN
ncbi:cytochrome p450 [Colletotrichum asianum]|uniref:3CxxC-type domain-containing protein n=1 Tax=Colletotrichum asianum TaxID=702518 RepID=A0A8H3WA10_9PEZI|nr:hypothetical protein GQ607_010554 [Colletotrichum asianum]